MAIEQKINGKLLRFDVQKDVDGVSLVVTNCDGEPIYGGNLLTIKSDGRYERQPYVNDCIGIKVNSDGYIKRDKQMDF